MKWTFMNGIKLSKLLVVITNYIITQKQMDGKSGKTIQFNGKLKIRVI